MTQTTQLVFFLEERSAEAMLRGLLPNIFPQLIETQYVVFEGKQDLEKQLPIKLKAWQHPDAKFVVMRDKDGGDCVAIKQNLVGKCNASDKAGVLVRIACHELESFYLGDLKVVAQTIGPANLENQQEKAKFRDPDKLANPAQELKNLASEYQKVSGSRAIGSFLDINNNTSKSFNILVSGLINLAGVTR